MAEQDNCAARIPIQVPSTDDAAASFVSLGGILSPSLRKQFGIDPLSQSPLLIQQCQLELEQNMPCPKRVFLH